MITSVELPSGKTFSTAGGSLKPKTSRQARRAGSRHCRRDVDQSREGDRKLTGDRIDVGLVERDHQLLTRAGRRFELDRRDSGRKVAADRRWRGSRHSSRGIRRPAVVGRERSRQLMSFPRRFRYPPVVGSTVTGRSGGSGDRRGRGPSEDSLGCAGAFPGIAFSMGSIARDSSCAGHDDETRRGRLHRSTTVAPRDGGHRRDQSAAGSRRAACAARRQLALRRLIVVGDQLLERLVDRLNDGRRWPGGDDRGRCLCRGRRIARNR